MLQNEFRKRYYIYLGKKEYKNLSLYYIRMGHEKQVMYNKRWRASNRDKVSAYKKKENKWIHISRQFRRIGIYDEYPENRGVRIY